MHAQLETSRPILTSCQDHARSCGDPVRSCSMLARAGIRYFLYRRYRYLVLENGLFGFGILVLSSDGSFVTGISVLYFGTFNAF